MNMNSMCEEMLNTLAFDVFAIDFETNEIVYANKHFRDKRSFNDKDPCYSVINGLEHRCPFCKRAELLSDGKPNAECIVYDFYNEFDEKWYQMQEKAVLWDNGRVVRYVIAVDVCKLKEAQNELAEAHALLAIKNMELESGQIQLAKQAKLGEILDLVAHQWKQPLSALHILFNELNMLRQSKELSDESLVDIYSNGKNIIESMNKTLDDFRAFFTPSHSKKSFDAANAVKSAYELLSKKLSYDNIDVTLNMQGPMPVYGVPSEFAQAVITVITNAAEAISSNKMKDGKIKISARQDGGFYEIEFIDNGGGIKEEFMPKIFEHRFTTKQVSGGSGVGLYIAKAIIEEKMGGRIDVTNKDGGACFVFRVPIPKD